jgi:glucokinase
LARLLVERVPPERLLVERGLLAVERDAVDRDPDARDDPDAREVDAREVDAREPEARDAVERLVLRVERELEVLAFVTAWRSLSKSLSACLLVLAASRRSARSAAVTSL